jgi:TnpA family transposase
MGSNIGPKRTDVNPANPAITTELERPISTRSARAVSGLEGLRQIPKSLFILRLIDDPMLRQAIEKQLDRIEHAHRLTRAVSVGNPREFLQAEKEDQEMAEACKRLIKNCIICWNYIYLSLKCPSHRGDVCRSTSPLDRRTTSRS